MYEEFYGLRERPFDLTPNPRFLMRTPGHVEALSALRYGLDSRKGLVLLLGEAGTGKTTVLRTALAASSGRNVTLLNPTLSRAELVEWLARAFELSAEARHSKPVLLDELTALLSRTADGRYAFIVDEAHAISDELLEEMRLLANIETDTEKLLPLILVGQPELAERLNKPSLRQLKQRVSLRCTLSALDLEQTAKYVAGRITVAGGEPKRLFTRDAVVRIFEYSGGLPRTISVICDNALLAGFAADRRPVESSTVDEVCRDLDLHPAVRVAISPVADREPQHPVTAAAVAADATSSHSKVPELFSGLFPRRRFLFF